VNPIALVKIGWKYYVVFVVVICSFGITAYLLYPETRGYSLEQISAIFDKEQDAHSIPLGISEKEGSTQNPTETVVDK
jgi:hypothetical protein